MMTALMMAGLLNAHAGHSPEIEVDNDLNVPVNVWIDGHWYGELARGKHRDYDVHPGPHEVQVVDLHGNVVLHTWVTAPHRGEVEVEVKDPFGSLHVHNESNAALYVQATGSRQGIWLTPGEKGTLRAPAGTVGVTASVDNGRGMRTVYQDRVSLRRGKTTHYDLEWFAPAPTYRPARPTQPARPAVQTVAYRPARPVATPTRPPCHR